ncbi:hypothetical protein [Streptomyces sp. NPDC058371]|uniref:hypothetical protein n=1 Tax=Streptomyces sp. NPDC058371 TaxID=3346463 RepID=UPI0036554DEC
MLVAFGTLVGCSASTEKKEYDVPKALCGVSMDRDLVSGFLPAGKKIDIQEKNPVPSRERCQVNIDGKVALVASQEWWQKGDNITDVADAHPQLDSVQPTANGTYVISGTGGVARAKSCTSPDHVDHVLYTAMQVYTPEQRDASAMKRLITRYTKEVERSSKCQ